MPDPLERRALPDREASALGSLHEDKAEIRRLRAEVERLHKAWQLQQNLLVQDAKDCEALRAENERLRGDVRAGVVVLAAVQGENERLREALTTIRDRPYSAATGPSQKAKWALSQLADPSDEQEAHRG